MLKKEKTRLPFEIHVVHLRTLLEQQANPSPSMLCRLPELGQGVQPGK